MSYDIEFTLGEDSRKHLSVGDTIELDVLTKTGGTVLRRFIVKKLRWLQDGVKIYADEKPLKKESEEDN